MSVHIRILAAALSALLAPLSLAAASPTQDAAAPGRAGPHRPATARDGDEYRLVFPASFEGSARVANSEADAVRASKFEGFVEQLNRAGADGYRLASFTYAHSGLPVGLVRRAASRYRYSWVEYRDQPHWLRGAGGVVEKVGEPTQKGTRLADLVRVELHCGPVSAENSSLGIEALGRECSTAYVILLERELGVERPVRFAVLGWEKTPAVPAAVAVRRKLSEGLIPKHALPGYGIWFEEGEAGERRWPADAEIELVWYDPSWWGTDTNRGVNGLARKGYRVGLINWDTAVMYRERGSAGFNYFWLDAKKKDFEKRLEGLRAKGAVYVSAYEEEDRLVFERRLADGGKRREYKVLKFEFRFEDEAGGKRVRVDLTPQGREALSNMRGLVREGFVVRDLFYAKSPGAILERPL